MHYKNNYPNKEKSYNLKNNANFCDSISCSNLNYCWIHISNNINKILEYNEIENLLWEYIKKKLFSLSYYNINKKEMDQVSSITNELVKSIINNDFNLFFSLLPNTSKKLYYKRRIHFIFYKAYNLYSKNK